MVFASIHVRIYEIRSSLAICFHRLVSTGKHGQHAMRMAHYKILQLQNRTNDYLVNININVNVTGIQSIFELHQFWYSRYPVWSL